MLGSRLLLRLAGLGLPAAPRWLCCPAIYHPGLALAVLGRLGGPEAVLIANTGGGSDDPALNGITLEIETCSDKAVCEGYLKAHESIAARPPLSVMWTCDPVMPAADQCSLAATVSKDMPWVHSGSAWYDGPRIVCT